jgi:protein-disulfide isomerase
MRFPAAILLASAVASACASSKGSSALVDAGATSAKAGAPQAGSNPAALDPSLTVATVNGASVTGKELDEAIHGELSHETDSYLEHVQKIREDGLDELIAEKLVDTESKARGVTKEQLVKAEIADKAPKPSDEELKAFYEKVVKPQYDVPFDAVRPQIVEQMMRAKSGERAKAFFDELRTKYKVKVSLPVRRLDVVATGPSRGPANAKVTIVEFSDFECPYCSRATPTVEAFMKKYDGRVRLVFRQFPLPMHKLAAKAAEGALCANEQSKFWPMYDKLFGNQERLQPSDIKGYAKELGLDTAKFDTCLDSGKMHAAVEADIEAGRAVGVDGTPAFFINGRPYSGAQPLEKFEEVIDAELNGT